MKLVVVSTILAALVACTSAAVFPFPIHASCKIDWLIGKPCSEAQTAIVNQIGTWKDDSNCPNHDNEKCLYALTSSDVTNGLLMATHMTPVKHYVDTLKFQFTVNDASSCKLHGESSSNTWYAVLDSGTNYCNMHNLITGSGLDKTTGYSEATSDSQCTQFSSANCDKY